MAKPRGGYQPDKKGGPDQDPEPRYPPTGGSGVSKPPPIRQDIHIHLDIDSRDLFLAAAIHGAFQSGKILEPPSMPRTDAQKIVEFVNEITKDQE